MKTQFIFLFAVATLFSCTKQTPVPQIDYAYCGQWGSQKRSIEIWQDGHANYMHKTSLGENIYACKVFFEANKTLHLHVTGKPQDFYFHIDVPPTVNDSTGLTTMQLDHEEFTKN